MSPDPLALFALARVTIDPPNGDVALNGLVLVNEYLRHPDNESLRVEVQRLAAGFSSHPDYDPAWRL